MAFSSQSSVSDKSKTVTLILAILFIGVHRFYVGKIGTGLLMLSTGGGFLVWWIIDIITIASGKFTDSQGRVIRN